MDGEAWWTAVHGVAQSRTRLKRLSSGSDYEIKYNLFWYCEMNLYKQLNTAILIVFDNLSLS